MRLLSIFTRKSLRSRALYWLHDRWRVRRLCCCRRAILFWIFRTHLNAATNFWQIVKGFLIGLRFDASIASWCILLSLLMSAFFLAIYLPVIKSEEEFLSVSFPEFAEYARRVPRLLPLIGAQAEQSRGFSRGLMACGWIIDEIAINEVEAYKKNPSTTTVETIDITRTSGFSRMAEVGRMRRQKCAAPSAA